MAALPLIELTIAQGGSYETLFTLIGDNGVATDLTGASAAMQIRADYADRQSPTTAALLTLSSATGGGLTLGGAAGTVRINITPDQSAGLVPPGYKAVWDIEIALANGEVEKIGGPVEIWPEVTR